MAENKVYHAFTSKYEGLSNKLINEVILEQKGSSKLCLAQWDTGASGSCVSEDVINDLGLIPIGMQTMQTPSGSKDVHTYLVDIILPNKVKVEGVVVCGSDIGNQGIQMLIGMDVINQGDFSVSNYDGKTVFSFRTPSKRTTDFVKEINIDNKIGPRHGKGKRKKK